MSHRKTEPTVSDLRLERYRLGELPAEERLAIASQIAGDPELQRRFAELDRSDREIAAAWPAHEMAEAVRRRARQSSAVRQTDRARSRGWLVPASVVATCVCLAAVVTSVWFWQPGGNDTTIKGGSDASLVLHRRVSDGSEELRRGAIARQGDQIRIGYRASGRAYGAIVSIDGRGTVTQHLPRTGEQAAALEPRGTVFLDFAYELDDAPRWEAFYFVTADTPFDLEPVRRAARKAAAGTAGTPAPLELPRTLSQFLFPVTKDQQ